MAHPTRLNGKRLRVIAGGVIAGLTRNRNLEGNRGRAFLGLLLLTLGMLLVQAFLPPAHPEVRLFSEGWGAAQFYTSGCDTPDDDLVQNTPLPPVVLNKVPVVRQPQDALALALNYLSMGLLLPVLAVWGALRYGRRYPGWLLLVGLGFAAAWFQWPLNPAFVALKQGIAEFWMAHWAMTDADLLWLDAITLLLWFAGGVLLLGGGALTAVCLAAFLTGANWRALAASTAPIVAALLFLGLTQQTALFLRGEGIPLDGLPELRAAILILGAGVSLWQGLPLLTASPLHGLFHRIVASVALMFPAAVLIGHGVVMYFHWTDRFHV